MMNLTPFVTLTGINGVLLVTLIIYTIVVSRRPKVVRPIVQGTVIEVYKGGKGLKVSYLYKGVEYSALQINSGVNQLPHPVEVGENVNVHVNPWKPSNVTLTPRPIRNEGHLIGWLFSYFGLLLISAALIPVLI